MERPILFNTAMVEAILEGRKTQTRRLVKNSLLQHSAEDEDRLWIEDENGEYCRSEEYAPVQPGDTLYVRETWKQAIQIFDMFPLQSYYIYKAGEQKKSPLMIPESKWRPSIHMPKAAARLWLRVKDVRCERLQDITEEDAEKEGLYKGWKPTPESSEANSARQAFMWLWDTTTDRGSFWNEWAGDPWVWVIEFERIEGPTP